MSRNGASLRALDLFNVAGSTDPWKSLISLDGQGPGLEETGAPRTLRVWASRGFQLVARSFRVRLTTGAGDISDTRELGVVGEFSVPTQGIALPVPAGNIRVDVAFTQALLPPDGSARVFGTITTGAPVLTLWPGTLVVANTGAATEVFLDPEDYPFAAFLRVTSNGNSNSLTFNGMGAVTLDDGGPAVDFPFVSEVRLANAMGGAVWFQFGIIS